MRGVGTLRSIIIFVTIIIIIIIIVIVTVIVIAPFAHTVTRSVQLAVS